MAFQQLVGSGLWIPPIVEGLQSDNVNQPNDNLLMDADQEESQIIGQVKIDGGGTKTFGTSGSSISWLPGSPITFAVNSTFRVGIKKASTIDTANGPAARATIGAAAFSVSRLLTGGTDTITATTWRTDTMNAGTPFSVADGDLMAISFLLTITSGSPAIRVRSIAVAATVPILPCLTLVTSGPTYTAQTAVPNIIITFDDGTIGWIDNSVVCSVLDTSAGTIGNGNIYANIFQLPFPCQVDAISTQLTSTTNAANFALELYSSPLGTPVLIESVAFDANVVTVINSPKLIIAKLTTPRTLLANTNYAVGVKQTTATAVNTQQMDVFAAAHFKPIGMGAECYAAISTAGGTFAQQNSGKRRYKSAVRISALDDGAGFPTTLGVRARRG